MNPWPTLPKGVNPMMLMAPWMMYSSRQRQRKMEIDKQMVEQAMARLEFKTIPDPAAEGGVLVVNNRGVEINDAEQKELMEQFKLISAERQEAVKKAQAELDAKLAEARAEQRRQSEEAARPFREARLAKKREYLKKQGINP
jgi:hypothetical protein